MRKYLVTSAAVLLAMSSSAYASDTMSMEQMQKQLEALSKQVEKLSAVVEQQNQVITAQKSQIENHDAKIAEQSEKVSQQSAKIGEIAAIAPAAGDANENAVKITMKPSPKFESADGKYSFQPTGRAHLDFTHFEDDKRDHPDGAHLRRARLGAKGDLGEDLNYKVEVDFGGESTNLTDAYLAYTGLEFADVVLGNAKPPMGLEQNTSSNYMTFIENSPATSAFTRSEVLGGTLKGGGDNWSLAGGVYNEDAGVNTTDDESWSGEIRGSVDLLQNSDNVLHVGASGSLRTPNASTETVTLSGKPAGTGSNMVTTGSIANVDSSAVLGAELAGVFGPFHMQGEYLNYSVDRDSGSDPEFNGWYAQAGYLLTGETRPYKGSTGNFDRVKPLRPFSLKEGAPGAWEVTARVDQLDLNDAGAGVTGGKMTDWTLGVNWYMTDNVRMMLNYVDVNTDNNAVVANDDPSVVTLRTQWDF